MINILLVEDQYNPRKAISILLRSEGYNVIETENGQDAFEKLEDHTFDLVVTDFKMEPVDGFEVLKRVKEQHPATEVILMTAFGSIESGVEAMKMGAYDYITKPFNNDEFLILVKRALEKRDTKKQVEYLTQKLNKEYKSDNIIGNSKPLKDVLKLVDLVANTDSSILITGESGTGKEVIAKAIHAKSQRKDKLLIPINCGSLPENLLESELFGHTKGAFTGAVKDKKGLFQEAHQGTVFLDEIGEIPLQTQVKLLRFLQEGEIRRVGDNKSQIVDVRLIAATNKNLEDEVTKNNFREDLYYRLNVIPINIPPLRERKEDIPLLVNHFLGRLTKKMKKELPQLSTSAMTFLINYNWPGNVRELENLMERVITLNNKKIIEVADLSFNAINNHKNLTELKRNKNFITIEDMERWLILETLENCSGNQKMASQILGISTSTLWRKLGQYRIDLASSNKLSE